MNQMNFTAKAHPKGTSFEARRAQRKQLLIQVAILAIRAHRTRDFDETDAFDLLCVLCAFAVNN